MLKRRDLSWVWFLLAGVLAGLYGVYWKIVHDRSIEIVGEEIAAWRGAGYEVSWTEMTSGGFPFKVEAVFEKPKVVAPPDVEPISWEGARLRVSLRPWSLDRVTITPEGLHTLNSRSYGALDGEAEDLTVRLRSDKLGLRSIVVDSGPAALVRHLNGETLVAARALDVRLERGRTDAGVYALVGEALAPEWAGGGAGEPESLRLDMEMTEADVLAVHRGLDARALSAWSAAQGRLSVRDLRFDWGDSDIGAAGEFWLDNAGRLAGDVAIDSAEPSRAFSHLAALGALDAETATRLGTVADALATGEDARARFSFDMRDGQARILGVPLGETPQAF